MSRSALIALACFAILGFAAASSISPDVDELTNQVDSSVSLRRDLKTLFPLSFHAKHGFFQYKHYPELKIKFQKYYKCHDDDECHDHEDEYKCDDDCEDDECEEHEDCHDDEEDECDKKYIRHCYLKDSHKKCDCEKTHHKKYYIVIKKKSHCH